MPFRWDAASGRYRTEDGRFVRDAVVRGALDQVIAAQAATMRAATQSLMGGTLMLADWQLQMMQSVKNVQLVALAAAGGGWQSLNQSDYGWIGQRIREQYRFLNGFARDIAAGRQTLDGTAMARATLYAEAARQTHRAAQRRLARMIGMDQERNQLGAADHCAGCLGETARGWVPVGTLVPCGSRQCLVRCHCTLIYRTVPAAKAAA